MTRLTLFCCTCYPFVDFYFEPMSNCGRTESNADGTTSTHTPTWQEETEVAIPFKFEIVRERTGLKMKVDRVTYPASSVFAWAKSNWNGVAFVNAEAGHKGGGIHPVDRRAGQGPSTQVVKVVTMTSVTSNRHFE